MVALGESLYCRDYHINVEYDIMTKLCEFENIIMF